MIFPKRKKSPPTFPLFKKGGGLSIKLDNPMNQLGTYGGLSYIPTAGEFADLEGIDLLEQRKAASDARLAEERAKRQPDAEKLKELQKQVQGQGLTRQTEEFMGGIQAHISDYQRKALENPDYVFSREGRSHLNQVNSLMNSDVVTRLKNNKGMWDKSAEGVNKKGIGSNFYVSDEGNVMLYNPQTGEQREVSAESFSRDYASPTSKYRGFVPMKNSEILDFYDKRAGLEESNFKDLGSAYNLEDVNSEINNYFSNLGKTEQKTVMDGLAQAGIQISGTDIPTMQQITRAYGGNSAQVKAAYQLAMGNLSAKAKAALTSDMLSKGIPVHGFNSKINERLGLEADKRKVYSSETGQQTSFIPGASAKEMKEDFGLDLPTLIPVEENTTVQADTWFLGGSKPMQTAILGYSSADKDLDKTKVYEKYPVSGKYYDFQDTGIFSGKNSSDDGRPLQGNLNLDNVQIEGHVVAPITTGKVLQYDKKSGRWVAAKEAPKDAIVYKGEDSQFGIDANATTQKDNEGKEYYETIEDGVKKRIYVQRVAMRRLKVMGEDGDESRTVMQPLNTVEALKHFTSTDLNIEDAQKNVQAVRANDSTGKAELTEDASDLLSSFFDSVTKEKQAAAAQGNTAYAGYLQEKQDLLSTYSKDPVRYKNELSKWATSVKNTNLLDQWRRQNATGKPQYTPKQPTYQP